MAMFDTIKLLTRPSPWWSRQASMGSVLLCAAPKGRRLIFPHARVLIHQPLIAGRFIGPATDIKHPGEGNGKSCAMS